MTQGETSRQKETALITGASYGIGKELARLFAERHYDLVLSARSEDALEALAEDLRKEFPVRVTVLPCDLSSPQEAAQVFNQWKEREGAVDILVNNAGFGLHGPFASLEVEKMQAMIRLNVETLTALSRLFLPEMVKRGKGRILNVASTAAFQPGPLMAVYYATKAYVLHFSEALREELRGTGVSVTVLCPGPTRTEFQARAGMGEVAIFTYASMDARSVARAGIKGLMRGKSVVIPGVVNNLMARLVRFTPRSWVPPIVKVLQEERGKG